MSYRLTTSSRAAVVFAACTLTAVGSASAQQTATPQAAAPAQSSVIAIPPASVPPILATPGCAAAEAADFPKAVLSNGLVKAVVYLPDSTRGYYRATRFDWSGVIGCLSAKGHTYFGPWFPRYDPLVNDSISGPAEEFKPRGGSLWLCGRETR